MCQKITTHYQCADCRKEHDTAKQDLECPDVRRHGSFTHCKRGYRVRDTYTVSGRCDPCSDKHKEKVAQQAQDEFAGQRERMKQDNDDEKWAAQEQEKQGLVRKAHRASGYRDYDPKYYT
jgi:hypothetical protein